jgi:hypothetical protein
LVPPPIPVPLAVPLAVPFTAPGAAPVAGISVEAPDPVEPDVLLVLVEAALLVADPLEVEPLVLIEPPPPVNEPSEPPSVASDRSRPPRPPLVVLPLVGPIGDEMSPDPSCVLP